ncbi:MAG TPA: helix-turn-helix domain-containing protein [Candidatus Cybelea sp.]|nr:helix-turn-helix domain-containing protein [Candidatus Cybelea sp.]
MARKPARKAKSKPRRGAAQSKRAKDPIDAALQLAAVQGWRHTSLADIAEASHLTIAELHRRYKSKAEIVAAFMRRIDGQMAKGGAKASAGESARDRLFETVMRRFDLLQPHRKGVTAIVRDSVYDPVALVCGLGPSARRTLDAILTAAELDAGGLIGAARRVGLGLIYADVARVWLTDDATDMSKTMAALDLRLKRAESLLRMLGRDAAPA